MPIKLLPLLLNIKKYSKKDPGCYTQSLSFLGICINYPNDYFRWSDPSRSGPPDPGIDKYFAGNVILLNL